VSPEHIALADLPAQPWKNGAGLTRELAVGPSGATMDCFDWRISVARIDRDAPFSAFDGIDRCIALLRGAGMVLRSNDGTIDTRLATVGEPFRFHGDVPIAATLVDGPCDDLNVMVRRGRWHAEVATIADEQCLEAADAGLVLTLAGAWRCRAADASLAPLQAWLWRTAMPATTVRPAAAGSRAIVVRLTASCQDRA